MNEKTICASANRGMGLWTSICVGFCGILGLESKAYKKKQKMVLDAANKRLKYELSKFGDNYTMSDYRITWSGKLSVTVSALVIAGDSQSKNTVSGDETELNKCPNCGAPIEDDMIFCGECGERIK